MPVLRRQQWIESPPAVVKMSKRRFTDGTKDDPGSYSVSLNWPPVIGVNEWVNKPATTSTKKWNPFQHYKCWLGSVSKLGGVEVMDYYYGSSLKPYSGVVDSPCWCWGSYGPYGEWGSFNRTFVGSEQIPPWVGISSGEEYILPPANLSALKQRSMNVMLPRIKAELSLLNSLFELKDFKSLPSTIRGIWKFGVKTKRTLREALRTASDGYLQLKFNILPLLSDISGIHAALSRTERRINDLITRQGRTQTRHFAYKWYETGKSSESHQYGYFASGQSVAAFRAANGGYNPVITRNVSHRRTVVNDASEFHAQIQYNYNYTEYQLLHAQLLGYLDAFGVNLNPAIIWNAIPWSFVIDWIVGVSNFLDQYQKKNLDPVINIHRYLWSIKRSRRIACASLVAHQNGTYYSVSKPTWVSQPILYETAYRRDVGVPTGSSVILSGLSSTEFSLGAALVFSRRRPRKKR